MQPHVELASAVANADRVFWQGGLAVERVLLWTW